MESGYRFSYMFPAPGDELSHNLISTTLENLNTSSMLSTLDFIDWLNYNSPISPMNILQTISSAFVNHLPNHNNYPMMFRTPGDELTHTLILSILHNIHTDASQLLRWLNYNPQISHIVDQTLSFAFLTNYCQYHGTHHSFSTMFPTLGDELSHNLIFTILHNIRTFSISNRSEFINWLNYDSPISPMNIDQTLSLVFVKYIRYQYLAQPLSHPSPVGAYRGPVGYVDETAIILMGDETSDEYEELISLQELIGHVNVGLTEKTISKNLKTTTLIPTSKVLVKDEGEICVVCQDKYKLKQKIGTLQCGHVYHANCIKQWLLQKNACPICKATALII